MERERPLTPDAVVRRLRESGIRVDVQTLHDGEWVLSPNDPDQLAEARGLLLQLIPGVTDVTTPEENPSRIYFRVEGVAAP